VVATTGTNVITTGAGNDTISGGAGNDTISAGPGTDSITGGAGVDNLTGGAGADTFILTNSTAGVLTVNQATPTTMVLSGTFNVGDVLTLQNYTPIPDTYYSYEVRAGDTLVNIAAGLAAAINGHDGMTASNGGTATITTNQAANNTISSVIQTSYEADTIADLATTSDVLQLSAATLNALLGANPSGNTGTVTAAATYTNGDNGATRSFTSFDAASIDAVASATTGAFVYNAVTGMLYLDQGGNDTWTNAGDLLTDVGQDDILIAVVGTIVGADIHIVA
jgi:hypothetical protein